ncbi:hypothetical protein EFK50_00825 [Nocardioides marmoriginsengisoli]|uniref:DUF6752 domain-containing protein n=1 Tax=Nocardioides marmoriginsengisoli TaxID=661483 RepID=A0A3N0CRU0_9ACTN|nr:DUF6752 domain-containing protein [Nocardioides marmoriginsengisoli]RNL66202.1 hypothetical protein EFK50_00825 [Nocardioides marmoriginsengisoli]
MKNPLSRDNRIAKLEARVTELMGAVEENRRLNERLSDVLDVMTELLVPAVDRDDERLKAALDALGKGKQRATD